MITPEEMENWSVHYDDPYNGAPPVDDAYKQDFSFKYPRRYNNRDVMSMVREFTEVMGQQPSALRSLDLVYEEYEEFRAADNPKDDLKELADLIYVLYGYADAQGYHLDEAIRRIHSNNLYRCVQADGTVRYREDGKVLKRTDAPKVQLDDLV